MKLEDCETNQIIHLTPGLTPIMGEAWKVGPNELEFKRIVWPVIWNNDRWNHNMAKDMLYLPKCVEVEIIE